MQTKLRYFGLLVVSLLMFNSCSDDEVIQNIEHSDGEQQVKSAVVTLNELELSNSTFVDAFKNLENRLENSDKYQSSSRTELDFEGISINTDDIVYSEYKDTHTYTFKMTRSNPKAYIENIVMHYNVDTGYYDEYLYKYNITSQEFKDIYAEGSNVFERPESISVESLNAGFVSDNIQTSRCTFSVKTVRVKCASGKHDVGENCAYKDNPDQYDVSKQAYKYQVTTITCSDGGQSDPILDAGPSSPGGLGNGDVLTNPSPGTPCENAAGAGLVGANGGCIVPIRIDDSGLTGKEKCINSHLTSSGNNYVQKLLSKFQGDSEFDIEIKSKPKVFSTNPDGTQKEVNGQTIFRSDNNNIEILISSSKASNRPVLSVARTILHEYIHADIFRKLNSNLILTIEELNFKTTYESYESQNFNPNQNHHDTMAELYLKEMAQALRDFHKNVLPSDYNNYKNFFGTEPTNTFYEAIAWQGLKNSGVQAYKNLSQQEKNQIAQYEQQINLLTKTCP